MERARSVNYRVTIDTNKRTVDEEFDNLDELIGWLGALADDGIVVDDIPTPVGRCATCRWAEWHLRGPAILEPIIGATVTPDVFGPVYEDFPICRHGWMGGRFIALPADFGCVMHEAK